jgi:hypothetical protein
MPRELLSDIEYLPNGGITVFEDMPKTYRLVSRRFDPRHTNATSFENLSPNEGLQKTRSNADRPPWEQL